MLTMHLTGGQSARESELGSFGTAHSLFVISLSLMGKHFMSRSISKSEHQPNILISL